MLFVEILFILFSLLMIFWSGSLLLATMTGVPIVYANNEAVRATLQAAGVKKDDLVVDLGCGDGRVMITAAKDFGARGVGVDRSFMCYLHSKWHAQIAKVADKVRVIKGDFKEAESDLKKADVVYVYLLNHVMRAIEPWLFASLKPGARVVALAFEFDKHQPIAESEVQNLGIPTKIRVYEKTV